MKQIGNEDMNGSGAGFEPSLSLADWLQKHGDELADMVEFSKAPLPDHAGGLQNELSRTQQEVGRAGSFLADVEAFLIGAEASATLEIRKSHPDFTAGERRTMVKDQIKDIERLAAQLRAVVRALNGKGYALMNLGRSRI